MVNVIGNSIGEEGQFMGNLQLLRKMIATSGKYVGKYADYLKSRYAYYISVIVCYVVFFIVVKSRFYQHQMCQTGFT